VVLVVEQVKEDLPAGVVLAAVALVQVRVQAVVVLVLESKLILKASSVSVIHQMQM
jgi:hypothetical protein